MKEERLKIESNYCDLQRETLILKETKKELGDRIMSLEGQLDEFVSLKSNLENQVRVLKESNIVFPNSSKKLLSELIESKNKVNQSESEKSPKFVKPIIPSTSIVRPTASHSIEDQTKIMKNKFVPTCHKCGFVGHIRPVCHLFKNGLKRKHDFSSKNKSWSLHKQVEHLLREVAKIAQIISLPHPHPSQPRSTWVPKPQSKALVVLTALAATDTNAWYFDSGCSKHLYGDLIVFSSSYSF